MRLRLAVSVSVATLVVAAASAVAAAPPTVLVIGDSVATGMYWHDDAIAVMQQGLGVYWDIAIAARSTAPAVRSTARARRR